MTLTRTITTQRTDSSASALGLSDISSSTPAKDAQEVRLIYPSAENNYQFSVAVVPPGSKWHAGAHWHEEYDEVMRVVKGRAKVRLGNQYRVVTPEDGEVMIKRGLIHDVMRADVDAKAGEGDEGELWLGERSDPVDGSKELLFRHMFSMMEDQKFYGWKFPLQLMLTMIYSDGYLVIVPGPAGWYVTHGLWAAIKFVALAVGLKPFYDEYTPARLEGVAKKLQEGGKSKNV